MCVFKTQEKVEKCYNAIVEVSNENNGNYNYGHNKRKYEEMMNQGSPSGVIDAYFGSDGSNDSWAVGSSSSSSLSLLCSSPSSQPLFKKTKSQEQQQMTLSPFIVGIVGTSP